jgi:hypothetical protein
MQAATAGAGVVDTQAGVCAAIRTGMEWGSSAVGIYLAPV